MYEDLLGPRPDKTKPKKNVKDKDGEEIDLEMEDSGSSVPEGSPPEEADPWKGVADDLDLEDLEDMDDCDGDCDNCDLECQDQDDENPEGC
jgi:hypothetical protein